MPTIPRIVQRMKENGNNAERSATFWTNLEDPNLADVTKETWLAGWWKARNGKFYWLLNAVDQDCKLDVFLIHGHAS